MGSSSLQYEYASLAGVVEYDWVGSCNKSNCDICFLEDCNVLGIRNRLSMYRHLYLCISRIVFSCMILKCRNINSKMT